MNSKQILAWAMVVVAAIKLAQLVQIARTTK